LHRTAISDQMQLENPPTAANSDSIGRKKTNKKNGAMEALFR
jgi:hypothetical protein